MELKINNLFEKYYVSITDKELGNRLICTFPAVIQILNGRQWKLKYTEIEEKENKIEASALVTVRPGYVLKIEDRWENPDNNKIRLNRKVTCLQADRKEGIRVTTELRMKDESAMSFRDYQIVFPGSVYNKNDTDFDGIDDYLGTYVQDYKDDRNPGLYETIWCSKSEVYVALIREDKPQKDVSITREQINKRHFIHDTDIGSLGFSPSPVDVSEVILRFDYPFYERNSYCLNVDASEWSAYKEMGAGDSFTASYLLMIGKAESLTEACWAVSKYQMDHILDENVKLKFTIDEAKECRQELLFNSYREFPDKEGCPAGFFVHFSPREHYGKQNILEFGFSGQQPMISYTMLLIGKEKKNEEYRRRALKTMDFFVKKCIHSSGIPYGLYDVDKEDYIFWWTGVLFPFQYSKNREELEKYLGEQVVSAIIPIAEELQKNDGNYTRTMVDAMYYLWKCYEAEKKDGIEHADWKKAVINFWDKMVETQNSNGSWNRAYTMEGQPLEKPVEWFGTNELEKGSGSIFMVAVMGQAYMETKDSKYLNAGLRAADFICDHMVSNVTYVGGLNDTTHKKSVKEDAVGVMFAMRSLVAAYEMSGNEKYMKAAAAAGKILSSWTYLWDIPFDKTTLLGKHEFGTTGWAGCDVIPACSYVDDEFAEFIPDLLKVADYEKDKYLARLAKIVFLGMQHGLSTYTDMYEYSMAGIQCEGYMTSLWLSDTETTDFSGAVAKNKGDDNDTCNGLINAQQLSTMNYLMENYQTMDMDKVIVKMFQE